MFFTLLKENIQVFFRHLFRPKILRKYPFLEIKDYKGRKTGYNWFYFVPEGWKYMIPCLLQDIEKICKDENIKLKDCMSIRDVKEKYGSLRIYASTHNKIQEQLSMYEALSEMLCINCGKPHVCFTKHWISPYCRKCWQKEWGKFKSVPEKFKYAVTEMQNGKIVAKKYNLKPIYDRVMLQIKGKK